MKTIRSIVITARREQAPALQWRMEFVHSPVTKTQEPFRSCVLFYQIS